MKRHHDQIAPQAWQPIDTAPKDKTKFLAFGKGHGNQVFSYDINEKSYPMFAVCSWRWHEGEKEVPVGDGLFRKEPCRVLEGWDCEFGFVPTHWMPLPEPPLKAEVKRAEAV